MIATLALLGYAVAAAWGAPALLAPLTRHGTSVRAGLATWLTAMASVLAATALAVWLSADTAAAGWPRLTQALCRSVAGDACTPEVYRSLAYQTGVTVLAAVLALTVLVGLCRYSRRVHRSRARTQAHAQAALLVGQAIVDPQSAVGGAATAGRAVLPLGTAFSDGTADGANPVRAPGGGVTGGAARTVVLDDPRPAAYCVAGRPAAIVVTSGALAVLDPPQLQAVLAHESAHLAHRHHALATVTRGLAGALPGVPLFAQGADEVARLTEMAADDAAAKQSGRAALVAALLAIATGRAVPVNALAAASCAVPARVERLLTPPRPAAAIARTTALTALATLLALAPAALSLLA